MAVSTKIFESYHADGYDIEKTLLYEGTKHSCIKTISDSYWDGDIKVYFWIFLYKSELALGNQEEDDDFLAHR